VTFALGECTAEAFTMDRRTFFTQAGVGTGILFATTTCLAEEKIVPEYQASDVEYIVGWLLGKDPDGAFEHMAGLPNEVFDVEKEVISYTDVTGVNWPKNFRGVGYDSLQVKIHSKGDDRKKKKLLPILIITCSIPDEPPEGFERKDFPQLKPLEKGDRCYYFEAHLADDAGLSTNSKLLFSGAKGKLKVKDISIRLS
jgi:hypothetical protein